MVLKCRFPDIEIPNVSVSNHFLELFKQGGNSTAFIETSSGEELTCADVVEKVEKLVSAFTKKGLKNQEVVAVCIQNSNYYPVVMLAVNGCNAIISPCNPNYTETELVNQFKICKPSYIITDFKQMEKIKKVASQIESVKRVFTLKEEHVDSDDTILNMIEKDDGSDFNPNLKVDPSEDLFILPFSSGTTGLPKGVMLTHKNIIAATSYLKIGQQEEDGVHGHVLKSSNQNGVHCHVLPLFHAYGILFMFLHAGNRPFVVMDRFRIGEFCQAVEKYKVTSVTAVPLVLTELSKNEVVKNFDLSTLKEIFSAAAPLAFDVQRNIEEKLNLKVLQVLGLSECWLVTSSSYIDCPIGSIGVLVPNSKLKIVNPENGQELGPNENGEICITGPQVMKGYFENEEKNKEAFDEGGWLRTGDIGYYTEEEFVFTVDRIKEIIKYNGFQVPPAELEGIIVSHEGVSDCGVVGIPDFRSGEIPRAYVVRSDENLTEEQLHEYVNEKIISYKRLRGGIIFIDSIPRSPAGKILRRKLKLLNPKSSGEN